MHTNYGTLAQVHSIMGSQPVVASRDGYTTIRHAVYRRVAVTGLMVSLSLLMTLCRHEALHIVGVYLTGGVITDVVWLPQLWTLAAVEVMPPLIDTAASYYVPLGLPYVGDLLLLVCGRALCRRFPLPLARWVFQHVVYFAALDILINGAAAFAWPNDWSLIVAGWGPWQYPGLVAVLLLTLLVVVWQRRAERHEHGKYGL